MQHPGGARHLLQPASATVSQDGLQAQVRSDQSCCRHGGCTVVHVSSSTSLDGQGPQQKAQMGQKVLTQPCPPTPVEGDPTWQPVDLA